MRAIARYLGRGFSASTYLRGSFAFDEPVYGLSDVDLVIVASPTGGRAGAARDSIRRRWGGLTRRLPTLGTLISVAVYEERDLRDAAVASWLTYGLDDTGESDRSIGFTSDTTADELGLRLRPELYGPTRQWRVLFGPDRRPAVRFPAGPERWHAAWLELQWWWRQAFLAAANPAALGTAYKCVKVMAESARIWLWVTHVEAVVDRREALEQALRHLPEEEPALRMALDLQRRLARLPEPPLGAALAFLARMSSRLARRLDDESGDGTEVELVWQGGGDAPLPLLDWRALTVPWRVPEEVFRLAEGDPTNPETLRRAAMAGDREPYPALAADRLLVFPTAEVWGHALLRAVQCPATDPVSFALIEGRNVTRFPDLPGWSGMDLARRAVAEHRDWLEENRRHGAAELVLAALLRALRAALFHMSLSAGHPRLPLTLRAATTSLAAQQPAARGIAEQAYAGYRASQLDGRRPDPAAVAALYDVVSRLPSYAGARRGN